MIALQMIGWQKGLKTVSLIEAVRDATSASLTESKLLVERLLAGERVDLNFSDMASANEFRTLAKELGVLFQE